MSTTPAGFWANFKTWIPAIELAGNVALTLSGYGAAFVPLITQIENAANPALQAIGSGSSTTSVVMTIYATIIGVLTALKSTPNLPTELLAQIEGWVTAAEAGTAGYVTAESGYNPANYTPVTPIA